MEISVLNQQNAKIVSNEIPPICLIYEIIGNCKVKRSKIVTFDGLDLKIKSGKVLKLVGYDDLAIDVETSSCHNGSVCIQAVKLNIGSYSFMMNYNSETQQVS